jgi:hypothetical protein
MNTAMIMIEKQDFLKELTNFSDQSSQWIALVIGLLILGGLSFRAYQYYQEWKLIKRIEKEGKRAYIFKIIRTELPLLRKKIPCINPAYMEEYAYNLWLILPDEIKKNNDLSNFNMQEIRDFVSEYKNASQRGTLRVSGNRSQMYIVKPSASHY